MLIRILLYSLVGIGGGLSANESVPPELVFYTEDYPPFSFEANDRVTGLNTEVLRAAAEQAGLNVQFRVVPWARAQAWTQRQSDACFFSAARSAERENIYQWAGPLSTEYITLYSADADFPKLASVTDAIGYRVGGQIADFYTDWGEQQGLSIERTAVIPDNLEMLLGGRMDLWLAGSIGGAYIGAQEGVTLYPVTQSQEAFTLWLACNNDMDPSIVSALDTIIEHYRTSGFIDKLLQNYR